MCKKLCLRCKHADCKSLLESQQENQRWCGNVTKCIDCGICLGRHKKKPKGFRCQECLEKRKLTLVCKNCGTKITYDAYYNTRRCVPCYRKWAVGENHHKWKSGKATCIDCGKLLSHWKFGGRCRVCASRLRCGKANRSWKGGRISAGMGYIKVYTPGHPNASRNYVLEHRLIMEKYLGRYLAKEEIVHHINGVKDDNRIENLAVVNRHTHESNTLLRIAQKKIRDLEEKLKVLRQK